MHIPNLCVDESLLSRLDLFRNVAVESVQAHLEKATITRVKAGTLLIQPEKENRHIYSVISGRLEVHLDSLDNPPFTCIEPGECVGEMSIIDQKKPSAYITASEDSELMTIDYDTIWSMVNISHALSRNLLYILSGRVRFDNVLLADSLEVQRRYQRYAMVDELTGLHNRRWMNDMFEREIRRCAIDNENLCLAMMDLDHFKDFNDRYGHPAGDLALAAIAVGIRNQLRPNDMVARYGGEEFALLFPRTGRSEALAIAERLRVHLGRVCIGKRGQETLPCITVSIGIAGMTQNDTLETLLAHADAALYRAKQKGRNCLSL